MFSLCVTFLLQSLWLLPTAVTGHEYLEYKEQWGYILSSSFRWYRCNILKESGSLLDCMATAKGLSGSWTMAFHENQAFITNFELNQTDVCDVSKDTHLLNACRSNPFYKQGYSPSDIEIIGDKAYILNGRDLDEAFISMCTINYSALEECQDIWRGTPYPFLMNIYGNKLHLTYSSSEPEDLQSIQVCPIDSSTGLISAPCTTTGPPGTLTFVPYKEWAYIFTAVFNETIEDYGREYDYIESAYYSGYGSEYQPLVFQLLKCEYDWQDGTLSNCENTGLEFRSPYSTRIEGNLLYILDEFDLQKCYIDPNQGNIIRCNSEAAGIPDVSYFDLIFDPSSARYSSLSVQLVMFMVISILLLNPAGIL